MTDNVTSFPVTPMIQNRRIEAEEREEREREEREEAEKAKNPLRDCIEPVPVDDEVITGCAKVEQMSHGLVRLWLYGEEAFIEPIKVIRAKLVIPTELAREIVAKITTELDARATVTDAG